MTVSEIVNNYLALLPKPDGWSDCVVVDGEDATTPYWNLQHGGSVTAWVEGVETSDSGLDEDLDAIRADALRMLAAVAACEWIRSKRARAS
jgi:hypothetical protein